MSRLRRILHLRLVSDALVLRIAQGLCFAAAPILLVVALMGLVRFATTPAEVFLGVLGCATLSILIVVMGLVLPLAEGKAKA